MAIVAPIAPPAVSPLPIPPSSTSPLDFDPRADSFLGALPTNQTQMNSLGNNVYDNALKTYNSANDTFTSAASAVSASNSATNAANIAQQSLSDMQKLYLGSKNSPPTEDNQGNPLQVGAWFVNSLQGYWYWWSGTEWKLGMSDLGSVDWTTQVTGKPNSLPGYGIVNQAQARTDLGLKSAAVADILGVVSQTGGVPTGAILQKGSNANGEFVRFADGTQICWFSPVFPSVAITTAVGSNFTSGNLTWTYPAAFISQAVFVPFLADVVLNMWVVGNGVAGGNTNTAGYLKVMTTASGTVTFRAAFLAVGRWF